jgi:hypothetical protein
MWGLIGKAFNGIAEDRLHLWNRKKTPPVPEMTRSELEAESKRLQELQAKKRKR